MLHLMHTIPTFNNANRLINISDCLSKAKGITRDVVLMKDTTRKATLQQNPETQPTNSVLGTSQDRKEFSRIYWREW